MIEIVLIVIALLAVLFGIWANRVNKRLEAEHRKIQQENNFLVKKLLEHRD